jgi:hypothetical protein
MTDRSCEAEIARPLTCKLKLRNCCSLWNSCFDEGTAKPELESVHPENDRLSCQVQTFLLRYTIVVIRSHLDTVLRRYI